jgi:hypothetical protein
MKKHMLFYLLMFFKESIELIINLNNNHLNYNIPCIQNGPLETIDFA